ncbi:MAG: hypothetical protein Q9167_005662 [Letrouitia subvulpina]
MPERDTGEFAAARNAVRNLRQDATNQASTKRPLPTKGIRDRSPVRRKRKNTRTQESPDRPVDTITEPLPIEDLSKVISQKPKSRIKIGDTAPEVKASNGVVSADLPTPQTLLQPCSDKLDSSSGLHDDSNEDSVRFDQSGQSSNFSDVSDQEKLARGASALESNKVTQFSVPAISKAAIIAETSTELSLRLRENDTIILIGQYDLWVRKGAVSLYGAVLHPSSQLHRVYAPSTHALPSLRLAPNPYGPAKQIAEITLSACKSRIRLLNQLSPKFSRIWNPKDTSIDERMPQKDLTQRTFTYLASSADDTYRRPLSLLGPQLDWQSIIDKLMFNKFATRPKAVLVCGPKSSGKSTFCRMLANAMITIPPIASGRDGTVTHGKSVAFLDIDPGQPEYSPPGDVSLIQLWSCNFGVPYTHPTASVERNRLIRAHHISAVSPIYDPAYYLSCVFDLLKHYHEMLVLHPFCPLIVNCSGWIQGSGLEILVELIHYFHLTDIIYMSTIGPSEVVESIEKAAADTRTSLYFLNSQPTATAVRTPTELRIMQTLSYFHLDEAELGCLRWDPTPINEISPLMVPYAGPGQSIFGVCLPGQDLDPEFISTVLDGCIVGVVVIEDDSALPFLAEKIESSFNDQGQVDEAPSSPGAISPEKSKDAAQSPILDSAGSNSVGPWEKVAESGRDSGRSRAQPEPIHQSRAGSSSLSHLHHPSILRTRDSIPYFPPVSGVTLAPTPTASYSLGQALIRGIDRERECFLLVTPIPATTLRSLDEQKKRIVLVRGKLDTPTWAYREDLSMRLARTKAVRKEQLYGEGENEWVGDDVRKWAERRPWVKVEKRRGKGKKVWKVRRDLGKRE